MPLVDVDLAIDTAIDAADEWDCDFSFERDKKIRDAFMALPTVDAAPVKHGWWIIKDNPGTGWYRVTCSGCGEDVTSTIPMIGFFPNCKATWDYCPYCGAKMDGGMKGMAE